MAYCFDDVTILLADDSETMSSMIGSVLRALGSGRVLTVANGLDALQILTAERVDLVITDWRMQPVDGLELVRRMRSGTEQQDRFVPIIMMTAYTEPERVTQALEAGVSDILVKPVTVDLLCKRLTRLIEKPRPFIKTDSYFGPLHTLPKAPTAAAGEPVFELEG